MPCTLHAEAATSMDIFLYFFVQISFTTCSFIVQLFKKRHNIDRMTFITELCIGLYIDLFDGGAGGGGGMFSYLHTVWKVYSMVFHPT